MLADLLAVIFVLALAGLGWIRGALVQVVTVMVAGGLYVGRALWYPPLDGPLADLAMPLAEHPPLRQLVGFVGAYIVCVALVAVVEYVARRWRGPERGLRGIGLAVGALKGLAFATLLIWLVDTAVLWDHDPNLPRPSWMRESTTFMVVAPWNPLRVYGLKRAIEQGLAERGGATAGRRSGAEERGAPDSAGARVEPLDDAAAAATPRSEREPSSLEPIPLEHDARVRRLWTASPMRALVDETASLSEWQGRGYGDLVRNPRVREVLGDADLADLFFGP